MHRVPWTVLLVGGAAIATVVIIATADTKKNSRDTGNSQRAALEQSIERKLPGQLEGMADGTVSAKGANCVEMRADRFECIAKVRAEDARGRSETVRLVILGSCDDRRCLWRTKEREGQQTGVQEQEAEARPEPRYGWGTVTCGEIWEAAEADEADWLAEAGEAVAYEAIARLPNDDPKRLTRFGQRSLEAVCGEVSNPGFQPYHAAVELLLGVEAP